MKRNILSLMSFIISFYFISLELSFAQKKLDGGVVGMPWNGARGITETVGDIAAREKAQPVLKAQGLRPRKEEFELPEKTQDNPLAPAVSQWPPLSEQQKLNKFLRTMAPQSVGVNFLGVQSSESGYIPPDCNGDVGPTQILVHVNGRVKVFDKSGVLGSLNVTDNVFWQSVRNGVDVSDPHVRYDRITGRWFLVIINLPASGANRILIAVSSGSTITNTSSFTFFQFQHDQVGTPSNGDTGGFADYPTLGVDANALYIGANIFNAAGTALLGTSAYVVRKSNLLSGTLTVTAFRQLTDGSTSGPFTPQGVQNDDPTATEGYFVGVDAVSFSTLIIRRVTNPGGTPSISGNISLTVPTTTYPIPQVVKGSASNHRLDALDDRLFAAQIKKNKITGIASLWTAHNIQVNSSGVASSSGGRNGSRWYEITNLTTTPTLNQSGTLYSSASTNPIGYWIPSVAMSGEGHMALGCSYASVVDYAGVAVAGRLSSDPMGTTQSPLLTHVSSTAYNVETVDGQRWGDFSQVVVDPNDDMTMWTFQEYCNTTDSWGMRVIQLLALPPATPVSTSPAMVNVGATSVNVVLTGTSTSGSGFFDPGTGYSNRISAAVNGGGITVNSITFTSPTSITLNITVAGNAATGARTITVTNPDGQSVTSTSGILTINNSSCPTITLSPTTLSDGAVSSPYNQSITASGGALPYTYIVASGALPNGLSLSSSGLLSGTPSAGGTFNFTVTATDNNGCTGSQPYTLHITGCSTITISPSTLPDDTVGIIYNQTISASGGTSPYSFTVTSGLLPSGVTLSSAGVLSGTPTGSGTSSFTVTATDASACTGNQSYSLTINASGGSSISLTTLGSPYTQNFNTLASTGTSSTVPTGWAFNESGSYANTTYTAGNGSGTAGDTYSFGATSSTERAFGGIQSGSLTPTIGANFTNNTGSTITSLAISYTGEQWRLGATGRVDRIDFQLSTDAASLTTGTWVNYDNLDFSSPVTTGTVGALDGNSSPNRSTINYTITGLNISNGAIFFIRWNDFNVTGADDGLAVDDFSITPNGSAPPTNPTVSGTANPSAVAAGNITLLTATITPGANPPSTGLAVVGNLSSIGGSTAQPFFDDGTHGDVTAGDNVHSFQATVSSSTTGGSKSLPVTVTDAQARTGSTSITLTVGPPCNTLTFSPLTLSNGNIGNVYDQAIIANGGTEPYLYTLSSGALPNGLSLSSSGIISGTPADSGSFNFTVTAAYSYGCTGSHSYTINVFDHAIPVTISVSRRWNLVSSPVAAVNDSLQVLFPSASSGAFSYDAGSYHANDRIVQGIGYWLKFPFAETLTVMGLPVAAETVTVRQGWNLVGSFSEPVGVSSIASIPPNLSTSKFYGYSEGYFSSDTIYPGKGYWMKANESGSIVLTPTPLNIFAGRIRIVPTSELPPLPPSSVSAVRTIPTKFALDQSYPNPFNPTTTITYALPVASKVTLKIYDLLGQVVATLVDEGQNEGYKKAEWDASSVTSGIYLCRLEAIGTSDPTKTFTQVKKMLLLK
jgi:hypothetical protein